MTLSAMPRLPDDDSMIRFRRALRIPRSVCGLHNYSDVNRFRSDGTRALMKALGCRRYWLNCSWLVLG